MKIYLAIRPDKKAKDFAAKIKSIINRGDFEFTNNVKGSNYICSIGGDGTLLHNIYIHRMLNIPFVSVNAGSVGHHALIKKGDITKNLSQINKIKPSSFKPIRVDIGDTFSDVAIQDLRIERLDHHAIVMRIKVHGKTIAKRHLADGVIITNPFGASGYNISAGGIKEKISQDELIITPICPFSSYPNIYDSLNKSIKYYDPIIEIIPEKEARLVLDNRAHRISGGSRVKITIDSNPFRVVLPGS